MSEDTPSPEQSGASGLGLDEIRDLLHLLGQTDVSEILIERSGTKVYIRRGLPGPAAGQASMPMAATLAHSFHPAVPAGYDPVVLAQHIPPVMPPYGGPVMPSSVYGHPPMEGEEAHGAAYTLKAPMVGTFYTSPSPAEPPFVREGDRILVGDTVCMIEAMKVMNEIDSDVSGRVIRILVKDGQPVEYGQPLMVIEPV